MNFGNDESQSDFLNNIFNELTYINPRMKVSEKINTKTEETTNQNEGAFFLDLNSEDSESQVMNFLNFDSNQTNQNTHIRKTSNIECTIPTMQTKSECVKTSNHAGNKLFNYAHTKRNRQESSSIIEAIQEEEEFFKERNNPPKVKEEKNMNVKSSHAGIKNFDMHQIRENFKKKPENNEKKEVIKLQNEQVYFRGEKNGSKKVILDENKEAMYGDWLSKYQDLEKQYLEKKEALKKIENLNKVYHEYYVKLENFKAKLPMYIEKSLLSYYDLLLEYESFCNLEDPEIDRLIEENRERIVRIKEKFRFEYS
jgi:hypothetical protein